MAVYRINYSKTIGQANEISSLADDMAREIQDLENLLATIKSQWRGPASEAFQGQLQMLIADMKTTKFDMSRVSATIKNTAAKIQQEDEERAKAQLSGSGGGGGGSF